MTEAFLQSPRHIMVIEVLLCLTNEVSRLT
jgi:hypothetical protein